MREDIPEALQYETRTTNNSHGDRKGSLFIVLGQSGNEDYEASIERFQNTQTNDRRSPHFLVGRHKNELAKMVENRRKAWFSGVDSRWQNHENLNKYAVIWKDINQTMWASKLTEFQGRDDHTKESLNPTPLQCYMLQQDLWLLEAMFKIIREVNGDSNANDLSVIKEIHHIALGREAQGGAATAQLSEWDPRLAPKGTEVDGSAIAGGGVIKQDHVARLFAADIEPACLHRFEHIAVAHLGTFERQASRCQIAFEPEIAHHCRHDPAAA